MGGEEEGGEGAGGDGGGAYAMQNYSIHLFEESFTVFMHGYM